MEDLRPKLKRLRSILGEMGSLVVAYSGGVDSSFLTLMAYEALGQNMLAVTATSETYPQAELEQAGSLAARRGFPHQVIHTEELKLEGFRSNPPDRCYHCKKELFTKLRAIAEERGFKWVADGSHLDDLKDYRPGRWAAEELGVRSPLGEAKLTKGEIRALSRDQGLPTWDKPAGACLASRFPYGEGISPEKLSMVSQAEDFLQSLGLHQVRVRYYGPMARIEVNPEAIPRLAGEHREKVVGKFKQIGFYSISLDLQGYRMGSMNEALNGLQRG